MKKNIRLTFLSVSALLLASCSSLPKVDGYSMYTVPSTDHSVGEVLRIEADREIVLDRPPVDERNVSKSTTLASEGILVAASQGELEGRLAGVVQGGADGSRTKAIQFSYTNTRVVNILESRLKDDLERYFRERPQDLKDYLSASKRRFFGLLAPKEDIQVVTGVLISDVAATIDRSTSAGANLSTDQVINLLGGSFTHDSSSSNRVVGKNLVIGFQSTDGLLRRLR